MPYRMIKGLFMRCRYWMEESPELREIVEKGMYDAAAIFSSFTKGSEAVRPAR